MIEAALNLILLGVGIIKFGMLMWVSVVLTGAVETKLNRLFPKATGEQMDDILHSAMWVFILVGFLVGMAAGVF